VQGVSEIALPLAPRHNKHCFASPFFIFSKKILPSEKSKKGCKKARPRKPETGLKFRVRFVVT
jgi:hypothetical protein